VIHDYACHIPSPSLPMATLGHHERRVDEAFFFIQRTPSRSSLATSVAAAVSAYRRMRAVESPQHDFLAIGDCVLSRAWRCSKVSHCAE